VKSGIRDSAGVYTVDALDNPSVRAAMNDPEGARRALYVYGELIGYPGSGIPPIFTNPGEVSWSENLAAATPLMLGLAWHNVEQAEGQTKTKMGQSAQIKQESNQMPVIQYTPSAGSMVEPGFYRGKLSEITEEDGQFGKQLRFQWVILDEDGEATDKEIRSWASCKWHEKSKLYAVAKALLKAKCPQPPAPIDTDNLINRRADLEVVAYKKADGSDGTKIGNIYPYGSMIEDAA
jgi:hypothetical protein